MAAVESFEEKKSDKCSVLISNSRSKWILGGTLRM